MYRHEILNLKGRRNKRSSRITCQNEFPLRNERRNFALLKHFSRSRDKTIRGEGREKKNEITPWRGSIIQSFKPRDKRPIKLSNQSRLNGSLSASARITLKLIFAFRKIDIRLTTITRAIVSRSPFKNRHAIFFRRLVRVTVIAARIMRCVYRCLTRKRWNSDVGYWARTGAVTATGSSVSAIPARLSTAFNNPDFIPRVWKGRSSVVSFYSIFYPRDTERALKW